MFVFGYEMKTVILASVLTTAAAAGSCVDTPGFVDERGATCDVYAGTDCRDAAGLTSLGLTQVLENCQDTCNSCVKAAEFCEIGQGGDMWNPTPEVALFDFYEQEFLSDVCNWVDAPDGLRQTTNAWGNQPGGLGWMHGHLEDRDLHRFHYGSRSVARR